MQYQLAEINIATFRVPMTDPVNADFIANLDRVNALAERALGFVWRLTGEGNDSLDIQAFDNPNTAINMSLWSDLDALANFVCRSEGHLAIMRRRREWFDIMELHLALWWVATDIVQQLRKEERDSKRCRESGLRPTPFYSTSHFPRRMLFQSRRDSTNMRERVVTSSRACSPDHPWMQAIRAPPISTARSAR